MNIKHEMIFYKEKIRQKEMDKEGLRKQRNSEIEAIKEKYFEPINKIDEQIEEYEKKLDYYRFIERYSTFDTDIIVYILTTLINIFEGKSYTNHTINATVPNFHRPGKQLEEKKVIRITTNEELETMPNLFLHPNVSNDIVKATKSLILRGKNDNATFEPKQITFCVNGFGLSEFEENFYYHESLSYVRDFIDEVIIHRIDNNLNQISQETLELLLYNFIMKNIVQIKENYKKIEAEQQKKINEESKQRILKLDVFVRKNHV